LRVAIHASLEEATGIARYTEKLLSELGSGVGGIQVKVFSYPTRPARPSWLPACVEYRRARFPGRLRQLLLERLTISPDRLFGLGDCDLLHLTKLIPLRSRLPVCATVYDVAWRVLGHDYRSVVTDQWVRGAEATIHAADHILAISRTTADELVKDGIRADRITVTPLGVDGRFHFSDRNASVVRSHLHLPDRFVLYVGAVNVRKNVSILVNAFSEPAPNLGADLVIAGPPPACGLAAWNLDRPWISHLGYVRDDDLLGLYAAAAAVVIPSRLEGFGLPLAEAMAAGAPVIASDIPVFREVGGEAPIYFPPDDPVALRVALSTVLRDPAAAEQMCSAGRAQASKYSWSACAEATAEGYRLAVRRRGGRSI